LLTNIFIAEFCAKHVSLGPIKYWTDQGHWIDGTVVMLSFVEIIATAASSGSSSTNLKSIKVLRALRVFRVFRLLKSLKSLQ
jgi:hypothetical protein